MALLVTGGISSLLILVGFIGVDVEEAYRFLAGFTIVVYFIPYCYLFAALLKLSGKGTAPEAAIIIPGGRFGSFLVAIVGFLTTAVAIVCALMPPGNSNPFKYEAKILGGCAMLLGFGWVLYKRGRKSEAIARPGSP